MYNTIIQGGIIFLLIYTPVAYGAVTERPIVMLEFVSGGLFLVWLLKLLPWRWRDSSRLPVPCKIPIIGLFALLGLQMVPLPGALVERLSPNAYRLYTEAATQTAMAIPKWVPLSVCTQATETEVWKYLAYAMVFVLIIKNIRTSKQVNRLVYTILAVGTGEAIYGLSPYLFSYKQHSLFNISGTFVNKNHFAGYLEMGILLAFGMLFTRFEPPHSSSSEPTSPPSEEKYFKAAWVLLFLIGPMIVAHLLSGSRGGVMSLTAGLIVFLVLVGSRRLLRRWIFILLVVVPIVLGIVVMIGQDTFFQRLGTIPEMEAQDSFRWRWEFWRSAVHIFQDFPVLGSGLGTFAHLSDRYQTIRHSFRYLFPENDYLHLVSETGIIGVALVVWIGFLFFSRTGRAWKQRHSRWAVAIGAGGLSALGSLLIHSSGDFNLHIPSNALLFTVIAALTYVTAHTTRSQRHASPTRHLSPSALVNWYSLILFGGVCVGCYLFQVVEFYRGFVQYEHFTRAVTTQKMSSDNNTPNDQSVSLRAAIQHDKHNAAYYYALGRSLSRDDEDPREAHPPEQIANDLHEAETWLKRAILLDPANPEYYYELGLLSNRRGDCVKPQEADLAERSAQECATARYFLAALHNAPKWTGLREMIGAWYYQYDQDAAYRLLRELLRQDPGNILESPAIARDFREFSQFLYNIRMDYESDREAARAMPFQNVTSERCPANVLFHSEDNQAIELGNDDNSAEWKTSLVADTDRVKKVICLPEHLDAYNYAALKIYMKSGGSGNSVVRVSVDDHLITQPDQTISLGLQAYEIPFDISLLQGKTQINVYIRVIGALLTGNALQIMGDQDTPTTHSVLNYQTTNDLSSAEGVQTGEYMIRLVLRT
jgi:O-antigen ligase/tetratricopeptide (TPR) repeat protein